MKISEIRNMTIDELNEKLTLNLLKEWNQAPSNLSVLAYRRPKLLNV